MPSCQLIIIDTLAGAGAWAWAPFNATHSNRATKNPLNQINTSDQSHGRKGMYFGWGIG